MLKSDRKLADTIEASGLDYTILRRTWFTDTDEVNDEITTRGKPEKKFGDFSKKPRNIDFGNYRIPEKIYSPKNSE